MSDEGCPDCGLDTVAIVNVEDDDSDDEVYCTACGWRP